MIMKDEKEGKVLSYQEKFERLMRYAHVVGAASVPLEPDEEQLDRELARYEAWLGSDVLDGKQ
jgi:hypothetical protein